MLTLCLMQIIPKKFYRKSQMTRNNLIPKERLIWRKITNDISLGDLTMSTVEESHTALKTAKERYEQGLATDDPVLKDGHFRAAFSSLYRGAEIANMLYTTMRRKGYREDGGLLSWSTTEFEIFIDVLYQKYYLKGAYSKEQIVQEFEKWSARVRSYVNKLDSQSKVEQSASRAIDEWHTKKKPNAQTQFRA
jgi:hypothetical protein